MTKDEFSKIETNYQSHARMTASELFFTYYTDMASMIVAHHEQQAEIEQLRKERDELMKALPHGCATCKYGMLDRDNPRCKSCLEPDDNWEWCGLNERNAENGACEL